MWTIAVSGKEKLRIQKYPDTCGRGLRELRVVSNSWGKSVLQATVDRIVVINKTIPFDARVKEVLSHR